MNKKILITILSSKIAIFLIIYLSFSLLPFASGTFYRNFVYQKDQPISLITAYQTWDAQHYLFLADKGYKKGNFSNSFYPLFPAVITLTTFFTRNFFISGIVIANIFSFIAFYYFYLFVKVFAHSEKIAFTALLFLLFFPTSFYFSLIYSESLFFLLSICFFYYLYKHKFLLAAVFSLLLPLTRPLGIVIVIPFLVYFIFNYFKFSFRKTSFYKTIDKNIFFLLFPFIGMSIYFLYLFLKTGSILEGFIVQQYSIAQWNFFNIFLPQKLFVNLFLIPWQVHGYINSGIDRVFFLFFLLFLPFIYKKTDKVLFIYAFCLGLTPFLGSFMSYIRYIVVIFPIFISLAVLVEQKYAYMKYSVLYVFLSLQTLFLILHILNYWVA